MMDGQTKIKIMKCVYHCEQWARKSKLFCKLQEKSPLLHFDKNVKKGVFLF